MSKLFNKYLELKQTQDEETYYLFKAGIFYIFISDDAKYMSNLLNLKLVNLNEDVVKCGFPSNNLTKYLNILSENNINFKIIDSTLNVVKSKETFLENENLLNQIIKIKNLNLEEITPKKAQDILFSFQDIIKNIY